MKRHLRQESTRPKQAGEIWGGGKERTQLGVGREWEALEQVVRGGGREQKRRSNTRGNGAEKAGNRD